MSISVKTNWVWDSWYFAAPDGLHAFYLQAPTSLGHPDLRHHHATVGHSISADAVTWSPVSDALLPGDSAAFDGQGIWTGSVIEHQGTWHMFYTGIDQTSRGRIQRIGHAVSSDLISWERTQTTPILEADERWYATAANDPRQEEPFRDPWVFYLEADGLWHMLLTARDNSGSEEAHGTIAHATSADLFSWELQAPLATETGFAQLEVLQVLEVEGRWVVIFCTAPGDVRRTDVPVAYATYSAPADGPLGPFHLDQAEPITAGGGVYAGRIVETSSGQLALMGFLDSGEPGGFQGIIGDPIAVQLSPRGTLVESSIITPVADNHTIAE